MPRTTPLGSYLFEMVQKGVSYSRDGELFFQVEKFSVNECFASCNLSRLMVDIISDAIGPQF